MGFDSSSLRQSKEAMEDVDYMQFDSAYSPEYKTVVDIVRVFKDTMGREILLCAVETGGQVLMMSFMPDELEGYWGQAL